MISATALSVTRLARAAVVAAPLAAVAMFAAAPAVAEEAPAVASGVYALDKTHASLTFRVSHLGLSLYTARFTDFDIDLTLDGETPENSAVEATVRPTSVRTDYPGEKDFDAEIATHANLFNVGAHPEVRFVSTSIERTGATAAIVTGDLTMLGATHPVTLDATLRGYLAQHPFVKKPAVGLSAVGAIDRTQWGMTYLAQGDIVGPMVEIIVEAEFVKAD